MKPRSSESVSVDRESKKLHSTEPNEYSRRYPVGAEIVPGGGVHFRVWAPESKRVEVRVSARTDFREAETFELKAEKHSAREADEDEEKEKEGKAEYYSGIVREAAK